MYWGFWKVSLIFWNVVYVFKKVESFSLFYEKVKVFNELR